MKKSLSIDNPKLFSEIDKRSLIPADIMNQYPTLHFCYEWDDMLIDEGCPEFEVCLCYEKTN